MKRYTLSGLEIPLSVICLGASLFGSQVTEGEAFALLDDFAQRGGTFADTAHVYADWLPGGQGASERTLGRWRRERGLAQRFAIGTKGGHPRLETMNISRLTPEDIARDVAESLERLGVETIDLYWLHRDNEEIPVGEMVDALNAHVGRGEIGILGASNWSAARIEDANRYAVGHGKAGFVASQVKWSLKNEQQAYDAATGARTMTGSELVDYRAMGVKVIPYSAQAGGFFAKPCRPSESDINRQRWHRARELAAKKQCTANQIALAYVLNHEGGGAAICAPRTREQMQDTCRAAHVMLTTEELCYLEGATTDYREDTV